MFESGQWKHHTNPPGVRGKQFTATLYKHSRRRGKITVHPGGLVLPYPHSNIVLTEILK